MIPFKASPTTQSAIRCRSCQRSSPPRAVTRLQELAHESERIAVHGREVYAWHPDGVARSKLWNALAGKDLGVTATARNWTTVNRLLEMAAA